MNIKLVLTILALLSWLVFAPSFQSTLQEPCPGGTIEIGGPGGTIICKDPDSGPGIEKPGPSVPAPEPGTPGEPTFREWTALVCPPGKFADGCSGTIELCDSIPGSFYVQTWRQGIEPPTAPRKVGLPFCTGPDTEQPPGEDQPPVLTIEDIQEYSIDPSPIYIEPSPDTLIRFETNFYTSKEMQNRIVEVAGYTYDVNIYPVEFTWSYGDGETLTTTNSGRKASSSKFGEKSPTTHAYQDTGTFTVGLTTKYIADFSVEGGPRMAIFGNGETVSPTVIMDVWRTDIRNVDESCVENPDGWGCPGTSTDGL